MKHKIVGFRIIRTRIEEIDVFLDEPCITKAFLKKFGKSNYTNGPMDKQELARYLAYRYLDDDQIPDYNGVYVDVSNEEAELTSVVNKLARRNWSLDITRIADRLEDPNDAPTFTSIPPASPESSS